MREKAAAHPAGFSLVELMMAMVVTMIVTGAIYGLLSGGQSAFRVQPERTERQQNIRNAMDAIMRDIATAGVGMPDLAQVFTPGLDNVGVAGPNGPTDILEMVTNPDNFPDLYVCGGSTDTNLVLADVSATFTTPRGVVLVTTDNPPRWAGVLVNAIASTNPTGGNFCPAGTPQRPSLTLATSCTGSGFGNALAPCNVATVNFGEVIRYVIRIDPADRVPSLWRTHPLGFPPDQLIARGIEDLQVEYIQANTVCTAANPCPPNVPPGGAPGAPLVSLTLPIPTPTNTDYNTIITQVQVTLSARSNVQGLQGQTGPAGQAQWLRASLTSVGSPRAALFAANKQQPLPVGTAPLWQ